MIKVIDQNGNVIDGIFRSETGCLVVDDAVKYNHYMTAKKIHQKQVEKINEVDNLKLDTKLNTEMIQNLKSEIGDIKHMLYKILSKMNEKSD